MPPSSPALIQQYSQRDVRTIEGVLFEAMVKAGAVSQDNANDPSKVLIQEFSSCSG
jgi:tRNA U38,U39,U40 pseudouridine synthase TruA